MLTLSSGEKWINVCWYFRPEQTVHPSSRTFADNEVFKTGLYSDIPIEEVIQKIFIQFYTRYVRGRPVGLGNRPLYFCESRYNEEKREIKQIKTWRSCVPGEIYYDDYEMEFFDRTKKLHRHTSPLMYLIPKDAPFHVGPPPEPLKPGNPNGPPILGNIYRVPEQPRSTSPSPPPGTYIPSLPLMDRGTFLNKNQYSRDALQGRYSRINGSHPSPSPGPGRPPLATHADGSPRGYNSNRQYSLLQNSPYGAAQRYGQQRGGVNTPANNAFTLPVEIPEEVASLFKRDDKGKVMWFSAPSLDAVGDHSVGEVNVGSHSEKWSSMSETVQQSRMKRRKRDQTLAAYKVGMAKKLKEEKRPSWLTDTVAEQALAESFMLIGK